MSRRILKRISHYTLNHLTSKLFRKNLKMRSIFCLGLVILYLFTKANAANRALIFNYEKISLIRLPNDSSNLKCQNWMITCPAKDDDERLFNDEHSIYDRALFLQKIYDSNDTCKDLDTAGCDDPYQISVVLITNSGTYEFGYEVFYGKDKLNGIPTLPYHLYFPLKRYEQDTKSLKRYEDSVNVIRDRHTVQLKLKDVEMGHAWIPLFRVTFRGGHLPNVEYEIRKNNINPRLECKDDSLGKEVMNPSLVTDLYTMKTQKNLFDEVKLPTRTTETDEDPQGACKPEYECLTKWSLVPTDQYQFGSDSPLICSNLTTIPIWKSTLEGIMKKLDQYLYALQRLSGQPLRINAGVHRILSLPHQRFTLKKEMILQKDGMKIEIPKIIYKIVKFKLDPCKKGQNCWYGVLIVIHNGPYRPIEKNELICEDLSGDLGWEEVRYETWSNEGAQSKFIYVCEISKSTLKSVGLTYSKDIIFEKLSLLKFPIFNEDKKLVFKSLKKELFDEMKRLSIPDEEVKLDDSLIERPSINYNFGTRSDDKDFVQENEKE